MSLIVDMEQYLQKPAFGLAFLFTSNQTHAHSYRNVVCAW